MGLKPYPNEHSARIREPEDFDDSTFRSKDVETGIRIIIGKLKGATGEDDPMVIQAYRFDDQKFTVSEAKKWLKDHDIKYIKFEPSTEASEEEQIEEATEGENNMGNENIKKFNCECIECGHKLESEQHCKDILCPECGGEMRRAERPGEGRTADKMQHKQFAINDFKSGKMDDGRVFIEGYANTKNREDRYGDVPTVLSKKRNYVYELQEFVKNPVLLLDHNNSTGNIAGSFNPKYGGHIYEDDIGLKFKAVFSDSDYPPVKHARTVYNEGHGRALSIGGQWFYEDENNPKNLTLAKIFEVSLVGVGADSAALTLKSPYSEGLNKNDSHQAGLPEDAKVGRVLSKANEGKIRKAQEALTEVLDALQKEEEKQCQQKQKTRTWKLTLRKKN